MEDQSKTKGISLADLIGEAVEKVNQLHPEDPPVDWAKIQEETRQDGKGKAKPTTT